MTSRSGTTAASSTVRLPADYVTTSTGLGYATTIHAAQGVSADTMHGLFTGQESRQQLYTMLTRGRHANHLYLQVVGDGDPHTLIRPDTISPRTPTETLQQILARDEAPVSASTVLRELNDPAARLFQAVQRYTDGLHVAAEQLVGPQTVAELDQADQYIPGLTTEPAWPTLRAHLLALAAETGEHPLRHLLTAASRTRPQHRRRHGRRPLLAPPRAHAYQPRSAALAPRHSSNAPCPSRLGAPTWQSDPNWSPTSPTRSKTTPAKVTPSQSGLPPGSHPSTALIGEIAVWRAANGINPQDPRPTGGRPTRNSSPPSGNNASTGISPVPPTRQQMRAPTSDRQQAPHLVQLRTGSAHTQNPNGVRAGRPRRGR